MRKPILTFALLVAFVAGSSVRAAEPAIKLVTLSVAHAFEGYWKTTENNRKLADQKTKAEETIADARKKLEALQNEVKAKDEESKNSALSKEAQDRAANEARTKFEELKQAEAQAQQFVANVQRSIQIQQRNFQELMLDEITKKALEIGKARGATLILDTSGQGVLYVDGGFDITDQVVTELNQSKPADFKDN